MCSQIITQSDYHIITYMKFVSNQEVLKRAPKQYASTLPPSQAIEAHIDITINPDDRGFYRSILLGSEYPLFSYRY